MKKYAKYALTLLVSLIATVATTACRPTATGSGDGSNASTAVKKTATLSSPVKFNGDSALACIKRQVSFGPRIPGTPENARCRDYIVGQLTRHGGKNIRVQHGEAEAYTGDRFKIGNVMASFGPDIKKRVLLAAHFDTRPWADSDPDRANRKTPVTGANDGASGVAVLLEMARLFASATPPVGVDMLFVDAEDYGKATGLTSNDESWCLGTQYWAAHCPYAPDSLPRYAILFDMVGGSGAKFHREQFSDHYARNIVDKIWSAAARSGYGEQFVNETGGAVIDDHVFLNNCGIPAIDIIESKNEMTGTFPPTWHTVNDTPANISPSSLEAVGQTVINVIFNEKP